MPPEFPMIDCLTNEDIQRCKKSWYIISRIHEGDNASSMLVSLVDEFYHRLISRASKFKKIFSNVRERASILTKALNFILSTNQLPDMIRKTKYAEMGTLHRGMGVSHWMFSMYMTTLIETVSYILKNHASIEVMESWTRVCSYTLRFFLEAIIRKEHVRNLEYAANFNTTLEDELKRRQDVTTAMSMARTMSDQSERTTVSTVSSQLFNNMDTVRENRSPSFQKTLYSHDETGDKNTPRSSISITSARSPRLLSGSRMGSPPATSRTSVSKKP
jgi:hemoglobin-like flavoprotein